MKKKLLRPQGYSKNRFLIYLVITILGSQVAESQEMAPGMSTSRHPYIDVIDKWFTLEIRLFKDERVFQWAFARPFAYSGICAYESIDPIFPENKYNGLSGLPEADKHKSYYWPASVNTH